MATDDGLALGGAVDGRIRDFPHQVHEGSAVVNLVVAHYDIVDLVEVNLFLEIIDELTAIRQP